MKQLNLNATVMELITQFQPILQYQECGKQIFLTFSAGSHLVSAVLEMKKNTKAPKIYDGLLSGAYECVSVTINKDAVPSTNIIL